MTIRKYATAAGFKQGLEERLRAASASGGDFARRRQLLVFDRFLARIVLELGDAVTLKGGLTVELRLERARTTKDVDLRVMDSPDAILDTLRAAARRDLGDFMVFTIQPDDRHPEIQNDGMRYDGMRFRAECSVAGKVYGRPFGVDVAFGDPILGEPDTIVADDVLAFAGIAPPALRDCAPRSTSRSPSGERTPYRRTCQSRQTPGRRPTPPWRLWIGLRGARSTVHDAARSFLDPLLAASLDATWEPKAWAWVRGTSPR